MLLRPQDDYYEIANPTFTTVHFFAARPGSRNKIIIQTLTSCGHELWHSKSKRWNGDTFSQEVL